MIKGFGFKYIAGKLFMENDGVDEDEEINDEHDYALTQLDMYGELIPIESIVTIKTFDESIEFTKDELIRFLKAFGQRV